MTNAEREAWLAIEPRIGSGRGGFSLDSGGEIDVRAPEVDDAAFPEVLPPFPFQGLHAAPDGTLWLQRHSAASDGVTRIDAMSADGVLLRSVHLPAGRRLLHVSADHLYASSYDELDQQWLERYPVGR